MTKQTKKKTQHEVPLDEALKNCRLAAKMSVEDVALTLNLKVTVIRDIEDNLDRVIEDKTYPTIYFRGYLANYAKAVNLLNLESFHQYQLLSNPEKSVSSLKNPHLFDEKKKKPVKLTVALSLLVVLIFATVMLLSNETPDIAVDSETLETETDNIEMRLPSGSSSIVHESNTDDAETTQPTLDVSADLDDLNVETIVSEENQDNDLDSETSVTLDLPEPNENTVTEQVVSIKRVQSTNSIPSHNEAESATAITHSLVVKFKEDCWTEITDANGKKLALDLYKAGRELTLAGTPPFNLVLGNPFVVELFYQGDLVEREFKRGRTARFTLPE